MQEVTILVELGSLRPDDATPDQTGALPLVTLLETTLAQMLEEGMVLDAEIAQTEAQRRAMWQRRELASEVMTSRQPTIDTDICLPTDQVASFLDRIHARLPALDAGAETIAVAHLGDGNLHFTVYPSDAAAAHYDRVVEASRGRGSGAGRLVFRRAWRRAVETGLDEAAQGSGGAVGDAGGEGGT